MNRLATVKRKSGDVCLSVIERSEIMVAELVECVSEYRDCDGAMLLLKSKGRLFMAEPPGTCADVRGLPI